MTVGAFNSAEAVGLAHFLNRQEYIDRIIFSRVSAVGREWPERLRPLTIPETARLIRQFERDRKELPKVLPGSFVYRFLNEIRRGAAGGMPTPSPESGGIRPNAKPCSGRSEREGRSCLNPPAMPGASLPGTAASIVRPAREGAFAGRS